MKLISAIVLAGGKSSRMGADKGLLKLSGLEMIGHVLKAVDPVADEILIATENPAYEKFGRRLCADLYKDCGPLGGIFSGMIHSGNDWNLVVSCDLPHLTTEFLEFLISKISVAPGLVPLHDGLLEPLCGLYHKSLIPSIESLLKKRKLKMQLAVKYFGAAVIEVPEEKFNAALLFKNVNSREDIAAL